MENVEGYEVSWDNNLIYLTFTDLFGEDGGVRYGFTPEDMERIRDSITEALIRHREGY
jgi:hypothetical protein